MSDFQLALLKVPVDDIDRAAAFYRDELGLKQQFLVAEYGWAQFAAGDLPLALYKPGMGGGDGKVGGSTGFHLTLSPDRFDALVQALLAKDHLVEGKVHKGDDGTTFVDVRDPDGNIIKIMRRSDAGGA